MTYLTSDRDALTEAECPDCGHGAFSHHIAGSCIVTTYGPPEDGFQPAEHCRCDETPAGALLASGAVIDASTLADDETLIGRLARAINAADDEALRRTNFEHLSATYDEQAEATLRALAVALTERSQR